MSTLLMYMVSLIAADPESVLYQKTDALDSNFGLCGITWHLLFVFRNMLKPDTHSICYPLASWFAILSRYLANSSPSSQEGPSCMD